MFWGPKMFAPNVPRIASGIILEFGFHKGTLGSSVAYGTVGVASGADEVEDGDSEGRGTAFTQAAPSKQAATTKEV